MTRYPSGSRGRRVERRGGSLASSWLLLRTLGQVFLEEILNAYRDLPTGVRRLDQIETLVNSAEATEPIENQDVIDVLVTGSEELQRQQVSRRCDVYPQTWRVEYGYGIGIAAVQEPLTASLSQSSGRPWLSAIRRRVS